MDYFEAIAKFEEMEQTLNNLGQAVKELLHHRDLLTGGITRIALEAGIIHKDATPSGPECLLLVEDIIWHIKSQRLHKDDDYEV